HDKFLSDGTGSAQKGYGDFRIHTKPLSQCSPPCHNFSKPVLNNLGIVDSERKVPFQSIFSRM
ncbi:MAG: hypothetical protein DRP70_02520, partial [Spirochaetes bacterium]